MLLLLRHGQTSANAEGRLQGGSDISLDEIGEGQARSIGQHISDRWAIDRVVTSSKRRAQETANLAGFGEHETVIDNRWTEIDFGEFEDASVGGTVATLSTRWRSDLEYVPPGGESLAALHRRVAAATEELIQEARHSNILVVTHATPIKSAIIWATQGPPSMIMNLWVTPGALSVLGHQHDNVVLRQFNRSSN